VPAPGRLMHTGAQNWPTVRHVQQYGKHRPIWQPGADHALRYAAIAPAEDTPECPLRPRTAAGEANENPDLQATGIEGFFIAQFGADARIPPEDGPLDRKTVAVNTAREAGRMLRERLGNAGRVEFKGSVDIVTEMDRASEAFITGALSAAFPADSMLAEEGAGFETGSEGRWIVDPLDGTTNYAHGFPFFCVSIAYERSGTVELGVVYNPMLDELFTAESGKGAYLNDNPIRVSSTADLDSSLLATGFPYDIRTSGNNNISHFTNFSLRAQAIRRAGSAALDICYVACGRFDGFWELKLKPWDVAAASLVVSEAGGVVSAFDGGEFSVYGDECLASNGALHSDMVSILNGREPGAP